MPKSGHLATYERGGEEGASGWLDPPGGRESGKGGARWLLHRGGGKAGTGSGRVHVGGGRRRGRVRVERRRLGGEGLVADTTHGRWRRAPVGDM
jgi:hypothetical protein